MDFQRLRYSAQTRAVNDEDLTVDVVASTPDLDSYHTRIDQQGWDFKAFRDNPVITWAHDDRGVTPSAGLPIARALPDTIRVVGQKLMMRLQFTPEDVNEFGYKVFRMIKSGFINGLSVGFEPVDWEDEEDDEGRSVRVFTQSKLLEVAVVTIPSNSNALVSRARQLNREGEVEQFRRLAMEIETIAERAVPPNVSMKKAPEDEAWSAPALKDFTEKNWYELSDAEKRHIAGHFAYAKNMPPETYGDLKLPHHDPKSGAVVFRGVAAAAARLNQSDIPSSDMAAVKAHLRKHYDQFDKEPPDALSRAAAKNDDEDQKDQGNDEQDEPDDDADETDRNVENTVLVDRAMFDKYKNHFEGKRAVRKVQNAILKRFFKRIGQTLPEDETEAWKQLGEHLDQMQEDLDAVTAKLDQMQQGSNIVDTDGGKGPQAGDEKIPEEEVDNTPNAVDKTKPADTDVEIDQEEVNNTPSTINGEKDSLRSRKDFVRLPLPVLQKLRTGFRSVLKDASEEALRLGVPNDEVVRNFDALGQKLQRAFSSNL